MKSVTTATKENYPCSLSQPYAFQAPYKSVKQQTLKLWSLLSVELILPIRCTLLSSNAQNINLHQAPFQPKKILMPQQSHSSMFQILEKAFLLLLDICATFNVCYLTAVYLLFAFQMNCDIFFSIVLLIIFQMHCGENSHLYKTTEKFQFLLYKWKFKMRLIDIFGQIIKNHSFSQCIY